MEVHGIGAEVILSETLCSHGAVDLLVTYDVGMTSSQVFISLDAIVVPQLSAWLSSPIDRLLNLVRCTLTTISQVRAELYKLSSLSLCSNTIGQLATGIMINPPKPGDPSFETFQKASKGVK